MGLCGAVASGCGCGLSVGSGLTLSGSGVAGDPWAVGILPSEIVVDTDGIVDGAVTEPKIAAGAVTETKIGTNAVVAAKIQAGAVVSAKIGAGAVDASKMAANAVTTEKVNDAAITVPKTGGNRGAMWRRSNTALTAGAGLTILTFNSTDTNGPGFNAGSPKVVPAGWGGWWTLSLLCKWPASIGAVDCYAIINMHDEEIRFPMSAGGLGWQVWGGSYSMPLAVSQGFAFSVYRESGSSHILARATATWTGPL